MKRVVSLQSALGLATSLAALFLALACGSDSSEDAPEAGEPAAVATRAEPRAGQPSSARGAEVQAAWEERAPLLVANSEIAVAELDGKIYVIGGYPSTRIVSSVVQVYDIARDAWSVGAPLPVALHHTMAAGVNGKLYVIGGGLAGAGGTAGNQSVDTVYELDPAKAAWTAKSPMPTKREGGAVTIIEGRIYVAGGRPPAGADFAVYDPATDRWSTLPKLPTQRNHLAAAAIGGKVYVAGGRFGGGVGSEMTDALEVFDPKTSTWESRANLPRVRAGLNGIAARGCLYTFGGEGNDSDPRGIFDDMDVYDPRSNTWAKLQAIPTPVHGVTGAAFAGGWIHLAGGGTSRGGNSGSLLHQVFRAPQSCE